MDVIELECPHCGDELELDAAFAGSVCRCSTCGTLMTVPADPQRERSEKIARRDRPDEPDAPGSGEKSERPESPNEPATPRAEAPGRPDVPSARPDSPVDEPAFDERPESPVAAMPGEEEVFVTDTGKAVQLHGKVPTARKRKKQAVRTTVIAAFVGLTLMLVVVIILAMNLLFGDKKPKIIDTPDVVGIDPSRNPIIDTTADILGVPIGTECAIIIDGTGFARSWFPMMSEIIAHETALAPATDFMVIAWTDIGPRVFPGDKPDKIGKDKVADLTRFLSRITTVNDGSVVAAAQKALDARADQLLIVTGRALEASELSDLSAAVSKRVDTRVDVVVIESEDAAFGDFAKANRGQYVRLKTDVLRQWYDAWKKGGAASTDKTDHAEKPGDKSDQ